VLQKERPVQLVKIRIEDIHPGGDEILQRNERVRIVCQNLERKLLVSPRDRLLHPG